jgi:hypothetical protein
MRLGAISRSAAPNSAATTARTAAAAAFWLAWHAPSRPKLTCSATLLLKLKKLSNATQPGRSPLQAAAISVGVTSSRALFVPSTKVLRLLSV